MHEKTMLLEKAAAREYRSYFLDVSGCILGRECMQ